MAGKLKFCAFGLTPRAGKHNHVYLLPDDKAETRRVAEQAAARVDELLGKLEGPVARDGDLLVICHKVTQPTTGRQACEWLCLRAPGRWKEVTPPIRAWLNDKFKEFCHLLETRTWNRARLYEVLPELSDWSRELADQISWDQLEFAVKSRQRPARSHSRFLVLGAWVGFAVIAAAIILWLKGDGLCQWTWPIPGRSSSSEQISSDQRGQNIEQVARALKINLEVSPRDDVYLEHIVQRLELLYEPESNPSGPSNDEDTIRRLEELLRRFYFDARRIKEPPLSITSSALPEDVVEDLGKLFRQNGEFDPLGLVSWDKDLVAWYRDTTYSQLYAMTNALTTKKDEGIITGDIGYWKNVFDDIDEAQTEIQRIIVNDLPKSQDESQLIRRFFVNGDRELAETVRLNYRRILTSLRNTGSSTFGQLRNIEGSFRASLQSMPLLSEENIKDISSVNRTLERPLRELNSLLRTWKSIGAGGEADFRHNGPR